LSKPLPERCWDRDQFIRAGFTPHDQVPAVFGVPRSIVSIVWHDMQGFLDGAISEWNKGKAGAHLCILRNGTVVRTVKIEDAAWHAGTDADTGRTTFWRTHNINPYSVGVELEGFFESGYTIEQSWAVRKISRWFEQKYGVMRRHTWDQITGQHAHSEISNQRQDPGPMFDWEWVVG
jgi:N-acetyl-anhydromuramyl-L-alanine amidase AmpD